MKKRRVRMNKLKGNLMSNVLKNVCYVCVCLIFSSCSTMIKNKAFKAVADGMAPSYEQKEKDAIRAKMLREQGVEVPNPMLAFLGEEDVDLVASSFPIIIKIYEMMMMQDKTHKGLALMTGEFYVMYANAFVESPAVFLPDAEYDKKNMELMRARKLYLKGYNLVLNSIDLSHKGFKSALNGGNEAEINDAIAKCGMQDVEALYWAGVAALAAFALEPLNTEMGNLVYAGHSMLEKAGELNSSYNKGAIWEVLTKFYAAAPESLGGGMDRANIAYEKAMQMSGGRNPSIYVTYATAFCIPKQDSKAFDNAIDMALSIDAKETPENVLMFTLSQNYARWLKEHKEDFILGDGLATE